jgi:hypothetical protein
MVVSMCVRAQRLLCVCWERGSVFRAQMSTTRTINQQNLYTLSSEIYIQYNTGVFTVY